jgi:DNA-binding transcriptional MerR regulator
MKEESNRGFLRIGDVAEIAKVPVHTLRYWEGMFKGIVQPYRSRGGQRRYSGQDIEKVLEIRKLLKEEGYSINGAQRILRNAEGEEGLPLLYRKKRLNWSHIAQEVTQLIRERLSEG